MASRLVKWVNDPVRYRKRLWQHSVWLFGVFSGVYLLISAMVACSVIGMLK